MIDDGVPRSTLKLVARGRAAVAKLSKLIASQPLVAKAVPTATGFAFGDVLTQQLGPLWPASEWPTKHDLTRHDLTKTALMAVVGGSVGAPLSLALYRLMDAIAPGTSIVLAAGKFTLDQVIGCVLWQAAYLSISEPYRRTFVEFIEAKQAQQACARPVAATC
eukprot:gene9643-9803_t